MSRVDALLARLEAASDWLSPIVVKEVRQVVRGREFLSAFSGSLLAGLFVAFFGAADALSGDGTSGRWTFMALTTCLTILGLVIVPVGAFSALRNERLEQTLELITLTALSPRRVVIGKLLAQGVKLAMLFAAVAPFIAMSFLLGGIDFVTILLALSLVFIWSLWICAVSLFLSTLLKSRTMSGLIFAAAGLMLFVVFGFGRMFFFVASRGVFMATPAFGFGGTRAQLWWGLAIATSFWLVSITNLVLLAENRLSLATENRTTALRVGFLAQFLLIIGWTLTYLGGSPAVTSNALEALAVLGGVHLALVAMFAITEDLVLPRRVLLEMKRPSPWNWLLSLFRPGGGRGAAYVLAQMAVFIAVAWLFTPSWMHVRWILAICGFICFFAAVPTVAYRAVKPTAAAALRLRVAVLLLLPLSMLLPDVIHYVLWQPPALDLKYSARHLINPMRTLANWDSVELRGWLALPTLFGLTGLLACGVLIQLGARMTEQPAVDDLAPAAAGEPGSAHVLH